MNNYKEGFFTISDIDIKYRIPLMGEYNYAVYECPICNNDMMDNMFNHACGFSEAPIGLVMITECPVCHEKFYSHADKNFYNCFLRAIDDNINVHYLKLK